MKRMIAAALLFVSCDAQSFAQGGRAPEHLSAWRYFKNAGPAAAAAALSSISLDRETLDQARTDGADLRLYDEAGREIPYTLRIRRQIDLRTVSVSQAFNRAVEGGSALVSLDVGANGAEHNEVDVSTFGDNFRRLADVEGSGDGEHWSTLASGAILFRFASAGQTVEQTAVHYPVSRFRYLRVRVNRDPQVDREAPEISDVQVRQATHVAGEMTPFAGTVEGPLFDRKDGRPATIWRIDLRGRVPIERLRLSVRQAGFARPFLLEGVDDPTMPEVLASGELERREDTGEVRDVDVNFSEHFVRRLRLTMIDDRNAPLSIFGAIGQGAMRQVVFETAAAGTERLRLYYGNPDAIAPHYDMRARIASDGTAIRLAAGPQQANPIYEPKALPLSERSPWLVYAVLIAASLLLAGILASIARGAKQAGGG